MFSPRFLRVNFSFALLQITARSYRPRLTSSLPTTLFKFRLFSSSTAKKKPEDLTKSEINSQTDPSVAKQYDDEIPKDKQVREFFELVDGNKVVLLNTHRKGVGLVGRSMAVAKRTGPDFLFLANTHSRKFSDLAKSSEVQITFQDSKTQDWASVSGTATTVFNSDPRIKELWNTGVEAWFGDLGDGKHDGCAEDPRMGLIEVKAGYITYWLHEKGKLGFMKEVGVAAAKGKVANTGVLREIGGDDIEVARKLS